MFIKIKELIKILNALCIFATGQDYGYQYGVKPFNLLNKSVSAHFLGLLKKELEQASFIFLSRTIKIY